MNLKKYIKVYKKFLHTSLASELEYKTNILVDLITAILSLIGSIFLLSIFFQNNGYIGGWKFEQALIIQAIYTILNGITNTWFNPNLTEIVKHIREGTLDFVLLKPIDSQFFISLKKIKRIHSISVLKNGKKMFTQIILMLSTQLVMQMMSQILPMKMFYLSLKILKIEKSI